MRRTIVLFASIAVAVVVTSGVAFAATIACQTGSLCEGTRQPDTINGSVGSDRILSLGGNDTVDGDLGDDWIDGDRGADKLFGDEGVDTLLGVVGNDIIDARDTTPPGAFLRFESASGGAGNDTIYADDGVIDLITCDGGKRDVVYYDAGKDLFYEGINRQTTPSSDCEKAIAN